MSAHLDRHPTDALAGSCGRRVARARAFSGLVVLWCLSSALGLAQDSKPSEYQLKAAYIFHFAQFIDWPSAAFGTEGAPLVIGILGENPFGPALERTVRGKNLNNHPLAVKEFRAIAEATNQCHILFVSSSEKKRLPEILAALSGTSVLTVSETDRFLESGGMINFALEGSKIRFQINEAAAKRAGLKMSSKLLSLALRP